MALNLPCCLVIALSIFSELASVSFSLSFNFTAFNSSNKAISYERSYPSNGSIYLTSNNANIGRSTYFEPLILWDNKTNVLTSFTTQFTFSIDSNYSKDYGDGLAFFLAPQGSRIPEGATEGRNLGLTQDGQSMNTKANKFIAVEIDFFQNKGIDPNQNHVGIDINSMESVAYSEWSNIIMDKKVNYAWINYDSSSKNFSIKYTCDFSNGSASVQYVHYEVDFREYLPELVTFGFSGAAGNKHAVITISSWSFSSDLEIDKNKTNSTVPNSNDKNMSNPSDVPNLQEVIKPEKRNVGLIVGLCLWLIFCF